MASRSSNNHQTQEKKFSLYIESYKKIIFKVANAYCYNLEYRKDLVQDIILQLWKAFPSFNEEHSISTWTYRIALNVSISFLRKESTRKNTREQYKHTAQLISIENIEMDDRLGKLYECIELLKPINKAIIILHLEGCRNKEIANIMGLTISNVSTRMQRIRKQLKICIQPIKQ